MFPSVIVAVKYCDSCTLYAVVWCSNLLLLMFYAQYKVVSTDLSSQYYSCLTYLSILLNYHNNNLVFMLLPIADNEDSIRI